MKNLILLPSLILACVFLAGCFGLAVAHPRRQCQDQFSLGQRGVIGNAALGANLTEAQVLALWGKPDSKRSGPNGEIIWRYQGNLAYGFVVPMYLIPVPLPFPAGHNDAEIYFKDGFARKASRRVMVYSGVAIAAPCEKGYMFDWETEAKSDPAK